MTFSSERDSSFSSDFSSVLSSNLSSDLSLERSLSLSSEREAVVPLDSFEDEQSFESLDDLIQRVNEHAESRDYAIVIACTKNNKDEEKRKT